MSAAALAALRDRAVRLRNDLLDADAAVDSARRAAATALSGIVPLTTDCAEERERLVRELVGLFDYLENAQVALTDALTELAAAAEPPALGGAR